MGRSIDNVIGGLSKARRARIEAKSVQLASEMIEHADYRTDKVKRGEQLSPRKD
jgi:hypothetical protein